jgi:hypothetical protein
VATITFYHEAGDPRLHVVGAVDASVPAADPGEPQEQVKSLNALLAAFMAVESPAVARPVNIAVTLYLDLPGTPEWVAFTADEPPSLVLGPGIGASAA